MKKLFLTLTFLLGIFCVHAAEVEVAKLPFGKNYWPGVSAYNKTATSDDNSWTIVNFNNNNNGWSDMIKCGSKSFASVAEIIYNNPVTVSKIELLMTSITASKVNSIKLYRASNVNFTDAEEIYSYKAETGSQEAVISNPVADQYYKVVFDLQQGSNGMVAVTGFILYAEEGDVTERVADPQFSVPAGSVEKGTMVELICETEGAAIYYTLDGTTPTTESTLYTAPITINETTTVSAIAVKDGMENSSVSKATYTVVPVYDTLAAFIEAAPEDNAIINAPLTVYYYCKSGSNHYLYVTDGAAKTFLYTNNSLEGNFENGDVIPAGVVGKYDTRYNEVVVDASSIGETTKGAAIEPTVVTEVTKEMLHDYIKIEGVTISGTTATVGDQEITLYNRFNTTIPEGEDMTLVGIVNIYNANGQSGTEGNLQVYPTAIIEPEPTEVAALTITPGFGTIYPGDQIVIDCETEGALLTGYIGDTELEGVTMPYTYTVNEAVGTKIDVAVYGHKAGLTHTEELAGEFTVAERPSLVNSEATFDWADIESLKSYLPEADRDNLANATKLPNYTFTNNVIQLTFARGSNSNNDPAYYTSDKSKALRMYTGNTMTVKLNSSVGHLDKITFVYESGSLSLAAGQEGFMSDNTVWTAAESRADNAISEVTFTTSATTRVESIKVAYTDVPTGITAVEAAESDAPAVFYNLQGIRVNNPANGIFIRVQGTNVDKVLVK